MNGERGCVWKQIAANDAARAGIYWVTAYPLKSSPILVAQAREMCYRCSDEKL